MKDPAIWISLASLAVSVGGLGLAIRYHCKRDDERFGRVLQKLGVTDE